jgi:hypothetical protein
VFAGIVKTTKLSLLGDLPLEISARISLKTQLKIEKGTPSLRYISTTLKLLQDLILAHKNKAYGCHLKVYLKSLHLNNRRIGKVKRKTIVNKLQLNKVYCRQ